MNKEEYIILEWFKRKDFPMTLHDASVVLEKTEKTLGPIFAELHTRGYLKIVGGYNPGDGSIAYDTKLALSYSGKKAMEEYRKSSKHTFWIELRAWTTLAVAVSGLALSIISLVLQSS